MGPRCHARKDNSSRRAPLRLSNHTLQARRKSADSAEQYGCSRGSNFQAIVCRGCHRTRRPGPGSLGPRARVSGSPIATRPAVLGCSRVGRRQDPTCLALHIVVRLCTSAIPWPLALGKVCSPQSAARSQRNFGTTPNILGRLLGKWPTFQSKPQKGSENLGF